MTTPIRVIWRVPLARYGAAREVHAFLRIARGHLGRQLVEKWELNKDADPQVYGIGIKELWEVDPGAPAGARHPYGRLAA